MSRYFLLVLMSTFYTGFCKASDDLFSLNFESLDSNKTIHLRDFVDRKIIIVAINASDPDTTQLLSLDTLFRNSNGRIAIIGVPVNDFGSPIQPDSLISLLRIRLHISFDVTAISKGKRGGEQHPLMEWVTTTSPQNHFNVNLDSAGEIFIIGVQGTLYAVLHTGIIINGEPMNSILQNEPIN